LAQVSIAARDTTTSPPSAGKARSASSSRSMWHLALGSLALAALACPAAAVVWAGKAAGGSGHGRAFRPAEGGLAAEDGVIKPFRFDQRLLICNAYPSESPMVVKKNDKEVLADEGHAIAFRECRFVTGQLSPHDKLEMSLRDMEIHGAFEVEDELPAGDAILLLVLEKREGSSIVSFQSLAFPTTTNNKGDVQLAVIDPFQETASARRLHMEDHISGKEEQTISKRVEELSFNRVYSIEAGVYDASVETLPHHHSNATGVVAGTKKLRLGKSQNYVVIRTGSGETGRFAESLTVFPDDLQSGSHPLAALTSWLITAAAVLSVAVAF